MPEIKKSLFTVALVHVFDLSHHGHPGQHHLNIPSSGAGERMSMVGVGSFLLSFVWRYLLRRKETGLRNRRRIGRTQIGWFTVCPAIAENRVRAR